MLQRTSTPETTAWRPRPKDRLQIQFSGLPFVLQKDVEVYDLDLFDTENEIVDTIHAAGAHAICYINAGSWEDWRPDASQYPKDIIGRDYEGWPGEKWLDIRQIDKLAPIMLARLDLCKSKGFDAVEPDNMEIHDNDTGFPLTYKDQLQYALWLADEAHKRGLAIGVKNAPDQVKDLVEHFDFAITEDAFYYNWAEDMLPFIASGKPVFAAEYTDLGGDFESYCHKSKELKFSIILKNRGLDAWLRTCS
jgi:hypothetical protein